MGMLVSRRRYLTAKEFGAQDQGAYAVAMGLRTQRREVQGTPFPNTVPFQTELRAAGYEALEDLQDVTATELQKRGLNAKQSRDVIKALAALPGGST